MPGRGGTEPINQQNGKRTGLHVARVSSDNEGLRCGTFSFCVNLHNVPDLPTCGVVMDVNLRGAHTATDVRLKEISSSYACLLKPAT